MSFGEFGYSLLEVLVVLSIISLIAAVVGPRLVGYLGKAKADTARVQMREIASAVELISSRMEATRV